MDAIEKKVVKVVWLFVNFLILTLVAIPNLAGEEKKKFYTAYNIWYKTPMKVRIINYKVYGDVTTNFLPAGTEVRKIDIDINNQGDRFLFFGAEGKTFQMTLFGKWHPGESLKNYKKKMFTTKTFEELTAGMTEKNIDGIKRGTPVAGMTKKAVLIAFGYPPEHRTKSLKLNHWRYWISKSHRLVICFDKNEIAIRCSKPDDLWKRWE